MKQNTIYIRNTKCKQKTALANKASYALVWYAFYDLQPGNGAGPIPRAPGPTYGFNAKRTERL